MSNNSLVVCDTFINQDAEGRFCLNDLHKASGNAPKHQPALWLKLDNTQELVLEVAKSLNLADIGNPISEKINNLEPVKIVKGFNQKQGTYVVKPLVYAYAMWISARFHLQVINAYDALVTGIFTDSLSEFLKPITETISIRDFEWRKQIIYQAFENLEKAQVETTVIFSGKELLARDRLEK